MKTSTLLKTCLLFAASLCLAAGLRAQSTGTITGRVLNPATGEYIRNAEIRIDGTRQVAVSEDGGYFRFTNAPLGEVSLTATYTGHETATAKVTVTASAPATHDFELAPTRGGRAGEEVIQLGAFIVETEREGQAKAVSEQKTAMNVKQVMSADNFGDMSEQNIGEFLKYMPGITIDYVETDTRAARMGGMDAKYGYVTIDGNTMATGTSGTFGSDTRQFEFESISMNNIDSIEVNKTLTADMSADAPAGTVNLRTRSALDIKRPKYGYTFGFIGNSYEHSFKSEPRHDDGKHPKSRPRFSFDYTSGPLLGGKFGVTVNGSFTNIYKEQFRNAYTYDYASTQAIAAGHPLLTTLAFKDGPKITEKSNGGLKFDYRPRPNLTMSASVAYSYFEDTFANRNLNFVTSAAQLGAGSSETKIVALPTGGSSTTTSLQQSGTTDDKRKDQTTLAYNVNWRGGRWTIEGAATYSRQREHRGALQDNTLGTADVRLNNTGWIAERSSPDSPSWFFTQTAGTDGVIHDWTNWANWGKNISQSNNATGSLARGKTEEYTAKVDFKRTMAWEVPTFYKFGLSDRVTTRARDQYDAFQSTYVGPENNQLTTSMPQSMASFWISDAWGGSVAHLPVPDKEALGQLRLSHPEYFVRSEANQATNLSSILGSPQSNQETIRAAYLMQNSRLGKWQLQAGLRYEGTSTISTVMHDVPVQKNPFATRTTSGGRTTFAVPNPLTLNYVLYRWGEGQETSWGAYHGWMPSASAKYSFSKNFNVKLGYNKSIKRPNLNNIAGPWTYATDSATGDVVVTIPNPGLSPETSERYSAMFEYYFEPAGTIGVHVFETNIKGAVDDGDPVSAAEAGFGTDPELNTYFFKTFTNLDQTRRYKGIEINYSQQLTFFRNELLRGLGVFATYSQYAVTPRPRDGKFFPRNATGGFSWRYRKFFMTLNATWTDETPTGGNVVSSTARFFPRDVEYLKARTILFVNAQYRFTKNTSVFISGDRAYDSGKTWYFKSDGRIRQMERYGSQWSLGIKGDF